MRQKITKEIITRETIKKELLLGCQERLYALLPAIPAFLLVEIIFGFAFFACGPAPLFVEILGYALLLLPPTIVLAVLIDVGVKKKKIKSSTFEVTLARLNDKREELLYRGSGRRRHYELVECFYFEGFARVEGVPHTTYQLADAGETFYIVTFGGGVVTLYYAAERYEFKELFDNTPDD